MTLVVTSAPIIKECRCGRQYTRETWKTLPGSKIYRLDWGEVHDMRNCPCGSSIVVVLEEGEAQDPRAGDRWKNRKTGRIAEIRAVMGSPLRVSYRYVPLTPSPPGVPVVIRATVSLSLARFYANFVPDHQESGT